MKAIYKRELSSYLRSPIGYVFIGLFLLVSGYFFTNINLTYKIDDISYMFSSQSFPSLSFILLFIIPLLTMRLIAEERHQKTDQLLLTSPVSPANIILGKFFAALTIMTISVLIMSIYPAILFIFGTPAIGPVVTLLFGFVLMSASLIALGIFTSSISENQIVAAIIAFVSLLFVWLIGLNPTLEKLSILSRFEEFAEGQMSLNTVLYFLTFSAIFLSLATWKFSVNKSRKNVMLCSGVLIIAIALNFVPWNVNWDLTQGKLFTLSAESKQVLSDLNQGVDIFLFTAKGDQDRYVSSLAYKYAAASRLVKVKTVDLESNTSLVEKYTTETSTINSGSVVVASGERFKALTMYDLYSSTTGFYADVFIAENAITSAIIDLTSERPTTVGILGGEMAEDIDIESLLLGEGIVSVMLDSMLSLNADAIDMLMIIDPINDLSDDEISTLDSFLLSDKSLQIYLSENTQDLPNLKNYLISNWDVKLAVDEITESVIILSSEDLFGERAYVVQAVKWQMQNSQEEVAEPKDLSPGAISLSRSELATCTIIVLLIMPFTILLLGLLVWLRRRRK